LASQKKSTVVWPGLGICTILNRGRKGQFFANLLGKKKARLFERTNTKKKGEAPGPKRMRTDPARERDQNFSEGAQGAIGPTLALASNEKD